MWPGALITPEATGIASGLAGLVGNGALVLVYLFFLLAFVVWHLVWGRPAARGEGP